SMRKAPSSGNGTGWCHLPGRGWLPGRRGDLPSPHTHAPSGSETPDRFFEFSLPTDSTEPRPSLTCLAEEAVVVAASDSLEVVAPQSPLEARQRPLVEPDRLRVLAERFAEDRQVVQCQGHVRVVGAEQFLLNRQRTAVKPTGTAGVAARGAERGE